MILKLAANLSNLEMSGQNHKKCFSFMLLKRYRVLINKLGKSKFLENCLLIFFPLLIICLSKLKGLLFWQILKSLKLQFWTLTLGKIFSKRLFVFWGLCTLRSRNEQPFENNPVVKNRFSRKNYKWIFCETGHWIQDFENVFLECFLIFDFENHWVFLSSFSSSSESSASE